MDDRELARMLRVWRDRLSPATRGLPVDGRRRVRGLRREELAALADISVDYLTRLEQARAVHPSAQVVAALARALRLTQDEREHLFRVAGQVDPDVGRVQSRLTPGVKRLLDRLTDVPVSVLDAAWNLVAWNPLWAALMGDPAGLAGRHRNVLWRHFTGVAGRIVRDEEEINNAEADMVADLRAACARYPGDDDLLALVGDLRRVSEQFASLWEARQVAVHGVWRKTINHPEVGLLTLDCDALMVQGSDLRVIVYTAAAGTADADGLALLGVLHSPSPALRSVR